MLFIRPLVPAVCALMLLPAMAQAEPDADAKKWLDRSTKHYSQGPYSLTYTMDVNVEQQGMAVAIEVAGDLLYGGANAQKASLDLTMSMPAVMPEPITMTTLIVNDEGTIWTEVDNPLMGGKQVTKMSAKAAAEQADKAGLMSGVDPSRMDPASQIEMFSEMADLKVMNVSDGKVKLAGPITEEFLSSLGPAADQMAGGKLTLVLSEKTGELQEMSLGTAEAPLMTARFEKLKFLKAQDIPAGSFSYTPPEGAVVKDTSASTTPEER